MIPLAPAIAVRPLIDSDAGALAELLNPLVATVPYSSEIDATTVLREIMAASPPTIFPVRWQQPGQQLGAWRAGQLVGFLDAGVGVDRDNLHLPDYQSLGLIRFLALPDRAELVGEVAHALFTAVLAFWQKTGVAHVQACHISTGYPSVHLGAGILAGEWADQVRVFTAQGFQFTERYYCLHRTLPEAFEEFVPGPDLSLAHRGRAGERLYQLYFRRTDWVAQARVVGRRVARTLDPRRIAYVTELHVHPQWQQQNIGRWLLRRMINDAGLEGYHELVVHINSHQHAAMNLFVQHGFEELNYRGYSLDMALRE
ncbi:MAG: GNAT family N-acetyltransferase [Litorilinea sp.]